MYNEKNLGKHEHDPLINIMFNIGQVSNSVQINLIGGSQYDHTTVSKRLAYDICEKEMKEEKEQFLIRNFTVDDMINFKKTMQSLPEENHILIFDATSFRNTDYNKGEKDRICKDFTEIGHIKNNPNLKFYIIINVSSKKSLQKYMRSSDITLYFNIPPDDINYIVKNGGIDRKKARKFSNIIRKARRSEDDEFKIKYNGSEYIYRKQFIPVLSDADTKTRIIMVPSLEWTNKKL